MFVAKNIVHDKTMPQGSVYHERFGAFEYDQDRARDIQHDYPLIASTAVLGQINMNTISSILLSLDHA